MRGKKKQKDPVGMNTSEIFAALAMLEKERGIPQTFMMEKIIQAITTAYKRDHDGVENVIVEHPVYGQLIGRLDIASRHDVEEFIRKVEGSSASPLSELTGGLHLHTLRCPDEASYERVLKELKKKGYLYSSTK